MKKNKATFMFPTIFIFMFGAILPILEILINIKKIENVYLSISIIGCLSLFILLCICAFVEEIYLINYLYTKLDISITQKIIWTILLLVFNILIIPYFYMKFILKEEKIFNKSLIYLIPVLLFSFIMFFGINTYNDGMNKIKAERKRIEEERNVYRTRDNVVSFTFRHGYEKSDVGEYDLYVQNKAKKIIFSAFTYDTTRYEQKTPDAFMEKGIKDISTGKEKFEMLKDKEYITYDDKKITTIEYKGKTKESSMCIYKISVIEFSSRPNYLVYVVEVITEKNYDLYKKELTEMLKNSKTN